MPKPEDVGGLSGAAGLGAGIVLIVQRLMGKKSDPKFVTHDLCAARIATFDAKLDGMAQKIEMVIELLKEK